MRSIMNKNLNSINDWIQVIDEKSPLRENKLVV